MKDKNRRQKKKNGVGVQALLGIKEFSEYGILTNDGEILFFHVSPTNISVMSATSIEIRIRQMMLVLSALPNIEIMCTDSAECFDDNKAYLIKREAAEENRKVKELIKRDRMYLDEIQAELSTAREFMFVIKCRNMKQPQVFSYANSVQKIITEQGFEAHRMKKEELKRLLALYFDATIFGEQIPDTEGEEYFTDRRDIN